MSSNYHTMSSSDFPEPPEISPHLVTFLQKVFPDKLPSNILNISDRELGVLVGQQKIIAYMKGLLENQIEKE